MGVVSGALEEDVVLRLEDGVVHLIRTTAPRSLRGDPTLVVRANVAVSGDNLRDATEQFFGGASEGRVRGGLWKVLRPNLSSPPDADRCLGPLFQRDIYDRCNSSPEVAHGRPSTS